MVKKTRRNSEKSNNCSPYKVAAETSPGSHHLLPSRLTCRSPGHHLSLEPSSVTCPSPDTCHQVKLDLLNGGDTPHDLLVKVEMEEEQEEGEEGRANMTVHNQVARWSSSGSEDAN